MDSDFSTRILGAADRDALHALFEGSGRLVPQHPDYPTASSGDSARWIGVFRGEDLKMAVPLAERPGRIGMKSLQSPLFSSFGGLVQARADSSASDHKKESLWRGCLEAFHAAVAGQADRIEVVFPPGIADLRCLAWNGWTIRPHYNYVTRWKTDGEWRDRCESTVRRQAKKAEGIGLGFRVANAGSTDELKELWKVNAAKQKLDAGLAARIATLGQWLEQRGTGFVIAVHDEEGKPHAAGLFGFDESRVHYLAGASNPERRGSGAPTLLHFALLAEIERRGLSRCYDWVGANTPQVARFKRGFNPELEVLFAATLESKRWKSLQTAKSLLR